MLCIIGKFNFSDAHRKPKINVISAQKESLSTPFKIICRALYLLKRSFVARMIVSPNNFFLTYMTNRLGKERHKGV